VDIVPSEPVTLGRDARRLLRSVIAAAREELADRDSDDVPVRLRKVAASSARSLPPPLEKALVDSLVADEAFRTAVTGRWSAVGEGDAVSELFLADPERAAPILEAMAAGSLLETERSRVGELTERVQDLERKLAEAKARTGAARDKARADIAALKAANRAARSSSTEGETAARRMAKSAVTEQRHTEAERDRLLGEVRELQRTVERLTERARRRADGAPSSVDRARHGALTNPGTEPAAIARHLDALERAVRPYRRAVDATMATDPEDPFMLPGGIAPDSAQAVDAVLAAPVDVIVLDGYNVAGVLGVEQFATSEGRAIVGTIATALARSSTAKVMVIFDAVGIVGRQAVRTDLGIEVIFAQDRSADEEIVDLVRNARGRWVVVTNDRELRDRCAHHGAVVLWSDAVASWWRR
jgi:hypothetical protein